MASMSDLIRRRRELKAKLDRINAEIDALDHELLARGGQLASAIEGSQRVQPRTGSFGSMTYQAAVAPSITKSAVGQNYSPNFTFTATDVYDVNGTLFPLTSATGSVADMAIAVLKAKNRPMKTGEIYDELIRLSVVVPGKNPRNNLAAHLSNSTKVTSSSAGWAIRNPDLLDEDTSAQTA